MKFNIKKSDIFYIVLSVFLAIFLWVYMMVVQNPDKTITYNDVSVNFVGRQTLLEEKGLSVIEGIDDASVSISLRGKYGDMIRLGDEDITVEADLSGITSTGEIRVVCTARVESYDVEILQPRSIYVDLVVDKIIEAQEFPVRLKQEVRAADGFRLGTATVNPTTILVRGPMTEVSRIAYAQVSLLESMPVSERVDAELPVTLVDADGRPLSLRFTVSLTEKVNVTLPVLMIKEVPLTINIANEGSGILLKNVVHEITPPNIRIAGEKSALENITSINVGTVDLRKEWDTYQYEFTFPIRVPEGILNLSEISTADVKISLSNTIIKPFVVSRINFINPPSNREVTAVTQQLEVRLFGDQDLLNALTADRISLLVDLSGISTTVGQKTVKASVNINPTSSGYIPIGDYQIVVDVKRK